jgi:hypothetical protein
MSIPASDEPGVEIMRSRARPLAIVVLLVALAGAIVGGMHLNDRSPESSNPAGLWVLAAWSLFTPILTEVILVLHAVEGYWRVGPLGLLVVLSWLVELALGILYLRRGGGIILIGVAASGLATYLLGSYYLFDGFLGPAWF